MSVNGDDETALHPRNTNVFYGHADSERALLESYQRGHMPHAWLIGGRPGIGKATLAYRMARFILAHPEHDAQEVQSATSLVVDTENSAARRIAGQAHPDLLVLERVLNERGKLRQDIAVDDVRRSVSFFGSTAGEGGWRVAIVDSVDELNDAGANALLKVLEEPPKRALMLLVSHAPGRVMPTIRSRCRRLMLRPLDTADIAPAIGSATGRDLSNLDVGTAVAASNGSVAGALGLLEGATLALHQRIYTMFEKLPDIDPRALHALGETLSGVDAKPLNTFMDLVNAWLSRRLAQSHKSAQKAAEVARAWEKVNRAARDVEEYNLERKPLVFSVFGLLADTARG